jgi:hypothetical protein
MLQILLLNLGQLEESGGCLEWEVAMPWTIGEIDPSPDAGRLASTPRLGVGSLQGANAAQGNDEELQEIVQDSHDRP